MELNVDVNVLIHLSPSAEMPATLHNIMASVFYRREGFEFWQEFHFVALLMTWNRWIICWLCTK